ncbi:MAG: efflux RND transporter periplasmic adaptor subunit [Sphingomonas sp.]|uniref:efflux RND transporter periplasmic adaptor subunit n=1 Tax=Sphingomonas sp. TaxID=28214 RepID=UPI0035632356
MSDPDPIEAATAPKGLKAVGIGAVVVAIAVVALGAVTRAEESHEAQHVSDAGAIPTVHLVPVAGGGAGDAISLPGTMEAWDAAKIYARVPGYVKAWYRDIGAVVPADAPLGSIDTPELDEQIVQARAGLASARAAEALARDTAARWNDLLTTNSVSKQEAAEKNGDLAVKHAAVQGAAADLGRLLAQKSFATVRAPFAGVVTTRAADIGDLVGPGATSQQPLFAIANINRLRIYVPVPQAYSAGMKPGLTATLAVPEYPGRLFRARLVGEANAISPQSGTMLVQLVADNPGGLLKPGGFAQVRFDVPGSAVAPQIPSSALIFRAKGTQVALVGPDAHIKLLSVKVGRDLGATVEISAGLVPGAKVVDNPPDSLADGELVRVGKANHV